MKETIIKKLNERYILTKRDMQDLKTIRKGLYRFDCEAYDIKDVGNLFFINMKALFGLMKMETAVITPVYKDLSFCNVDTIDAMSSQTYMFEMYESSLKKTDLSSFEGIKDRYSYLKDYESSPRWYDELRLSSSISKTGKKISADGEKFLNECLDEYLKLLSEAKDCDPEKKKAAVRTYVDKLIEKGGAAVDSMNKIIGPEKTSKLIREFMYNI